VVPGQPGLYFVGQLFLYSVSPAMSHGLARDARHVARHIASRRRPGTTPSNQAAVAATSELTG
jgi:putative flavoprotein involved in K+ transport